MLARAAACRCCSIHTIAGAIKGKFATIVKMSWRTRGCAKEQISAEVRVFGLSEREQRSDELLERTSKTKSGARRVVGVKSRRVMPAIQSDCRLSATLSLRPSPLHRTIACFSRKSVELFVSSRIPSGSTSPRPPPCGKVGPQTGPHLRPRHPPLPTLRAVKPLHPLLPLLFITLFLFFLLIARTNTAIACNSIHPHSTFHALIPNYVPSSCTHLQASYFTPRILYSVTWAPRGPHTLEWKKNEKKFHSIPSQ
jgi:hypothetical protein